MNKFAMTVAVMAAFAASAAEATITYSGNVTATNAATASYTITTDGTLGTLSAPNFVGYTLSINNVASSGTGIFAGLDGSGAASATATALSFDFSLASGQALIFFDGGSYLCFNNAGISCVGEPTPSVAFGNFSDSTFGSFDPRSATVQVIATSGAVPEPASWAMLIAGFGLTGAVMRRRRVALAA